MCDRSNAEEIVSEMLSYLETADYSIREEMVWKSHFPFEFSFFSSPVQMVPQAILLLKPVIEYI